MNGDDEARVLNVGLNLLPEFGDVGIDGPRESHRVNAPYLIEHLLAGHGFAPVRDQEFQ